MFVCPLHRLPRLARYLQVAFIISNFFENLKLETCMVYQELGEMDQILSANQSLTHSDLPGRGAGPSFLKFKLVSQSSPEELFLVLHS